MLNKFVENVNYDLNLNLLKLNLKFIENINYVSRMLKICWKCQLYMKLDEVITFSGEFIEDDGEEYHDQEQGNVNEGHRNCCHDLWKIVELKFGDRNYLLIT